MKRFKTPSGPVTAAKIRQSMLQAERQRNGERTESDVRSAMIARGDVMVEKTEVGFRLDKNGNRYPLRKVSGDFRAVRKIYATYRFEGVTYECEPIGVSVMVEVKHHDERLPWGAFTRRDGSHQSEELDLHLKTGGITEVAWMDRGVLRFIPWQEFKRVGFGPGTSVVWTGSIIAIHNSASRTKTKKEHP